MEVEGEGEGEEGEGEGREEEEDVEGAGIADTGPREVGGVCVPTLERPNKS